MTRKQLAQAEELKTWLEQFRPDVEWRAHWNYHTKLIEFTATNEVGGFAFTMIKTYAGKTYISLNYNDTTKAENGMIVSEGFGTDLLKEELPRLNFGRYLEFVRINAYLVSENVPVIAE